MRQPLQPAAPRAVPGTVAALSGILATAVALGVAELLAGVLEGSRSLVIAVGDLVIDSVPGWLERAAIALLGTADKPVLIGGTLVICAAVGAGLGMLARRHFAAAAVGFVVLAALGVAASLADARTVALAAAAAGLAGVAAGVGALWLLLRAAAVPSAAAPLPEGGTSDGAASDAADRAGRVEPRTAGEPAARGSSPPAGASPGRRAFLTVAAACVGVAALGAAGGRWLASSAQLEAVRAALRIPRPARPAAPVPPGADLEIPGLAPLFVPNEEFYRIDTALRVPQVDHTTWSLEIRGMVDRPFSLTYAELLELPHIEADITLACVSNPVGGDLVGNARWQGVPLHVLLDRAGVDPGATQLIGRSVDGFTAGFPTITALDVRESMVAVAMNGEPLPPVHGFPARLVVPGLYGYVSATKWLSAIELTTFEDTVGYWVPRGWAREGPVKTQSRIDVPAPSAAVSAGLRPVAGVAWAPTRGIERVEVRVDDGPWEVAELAASLDVDCWRQWVYQWEATPGRHLLTVRASDGTGETQTAERTPVAPDGASGWHTIEVLVEG